MRNKGNATVMTRPPVWEKERAQHIKSGFAQFEPLKHKNGEKFTDIEYFCLLAEECEEIEANNPYPNLPPDYGDYDRDVVSIAKQVKEAHDNGVSENEIIHFLNMCIDKNE